MSLRDRFPSVAALLRLGDADETETTNAPTEDEDGNDDGEDGVKKPKPAADGEDDGDGDGDGQGDDAGQAQPGANALETVRSLGSIASDAQLLDAFDRDANLLVAGERQRCIDIFTSREGKANPDGAAAVIVDTDMTAPKAIKFLGTFGSNNRSLGRDRLNHGTETSPRTGASTDMAAASADVLTTHKEKRKARSAAAAKRGQVQVGKEPAETEA
ncbi:MAG: hypothetical protein V4696_03660 [Pseudomonadota bacterium]